MWTATFDWIRSRYSHTKRLRMAPGPRSLACMTFWSRKKEFIYLFWQIFYYAVSLSIAPRSKKFNLKPISARQIFLEFFDESSHRGALWGYKTKSKNSGQYLHPLRYQDMEILNFSSFVNSATLFSNQLFLQYLNSFASYTQKKNFYY